MTKRKPKPITPAEHRAAVAGYRAAERTFGSSDAYRDYVDGLNEANIRLHGVLMKRLIADAEKFTTIKARGLVVAVFGPCKKQKQKGKTK